MALSISVVIPVLNEQEHINPAISQLRLLDSAVEIIVVDGDRSGSTVNLISDNSVIKIIAAKGRGNQLATGAEVAKGDIILMLHADTLLPDISFKAIRKTIENGAGWGAFRLGVGSDSFIYRIIERAVDLRSAVFRMPFGDQAIFLLRDLLNSIGGVPPIPLMEDVELVRRLNNAGYRFGLLKERVITSPRRWQRDGILKRTVNNWWLLLSYFAGADTKLLASKYQ